MKLRDASGDSIEWIRDWFEDGSQSPGSLRMLFQLVHRTRHKYHNINITRISQEIEKYRFQIQDYPDGKHLANMSFDSLADGLSACSNTIYHHLLCCLAGKSACPILGSQVFNYESQPGSWLVVICEGSENRGSGGGLLPSGSKMVEIGGVLGPGSMVLQGNVPGGKTVTVGIDSS